MSIGSMLFIFLLGGGCIYAYLMSGEGNKLIKTWPTTPGKILKSDVFDAPRKHELTLEYEFYVKGVRYVSGNIYRNSPRYELGYPYDLDKVEFLKNPEVKYNPENPADCCLLLYLEGKFWPRLLFLIAGIVFILIGLLGILVRMTK